MKKKICILTATRAEYGLLKPVIAKLGTISGFDVRIAATGAHLSPEFGLTYRDIERDGFAIDEKIEMLLSSDSPSAISKSMGLALISFADYFERLRPDILLMLGDRYETLAVAIAAMNGRIPIAHMYGGETTEGAVDESIRHAITKMSYLHFTSTEQYRRRVIQLGESPERVFNVGSTGVENILNEKLLSREQFTEFAGLDADRAYAVATFHPVTLEHNSAEEQIKTLLEVCASYTNLDFIFTKANADANGRIINEMIDKYAGTHNNIKTFTSLGTIRYLSALKHCEAAIGNSSSGVTEAPSFGVPTINVGDRQRGRIMAESVINCTPDRADIKRAIDRALGAEFKSIAQNASNPYGKGNTSSSIVSVIRDYISKDKINLKKTFYDCGCVS